MFSSVIEWNVETCSRISMNQNFLTKHAWHL